MTQTSTTVHTCTKCQKVRPWSQGWLIAAKGYPGFCSMKRLEVFLLPLDGMLVHRRSLPRNFVRLRVKPLRVYNNILYHCAAQQLHVHTLLATCILLW